MMQPLQLSVNNVGACILYIVITYKNIKITSTNICTYLWILSGVKYKEFYLTEKKKKILLVLMFYKLFLKCNYKLMII